MIRAAVIEGVATATEVSTIGIVYSDARGPADLPPLRLAASLPDAGRDGGAVGRDPAHHRRSDRHGLGADAVGILATLLATFMTSLPGGVPMFLAVSIVAFVMLGSVLEGIPAIVLFGPAAVPDRQAGRGA